MGRDYAGGIQGRLLSDMSRRVQSRRQGRVGTNTVLSQSISQALPSGMVDYSSQLSLLPEKFISTTISKGTQNPHDDVADVRRRQHDDHDVITAQQRSFESPHN